MTAAAFTATSVPMDMAGFLGTEVAEEVRHKVASLLNIKNETKRRLSEVLVDRWMLYETSEDSIYVRHVPANRANVLYQIVLSGKPWDGVYELVLKGKQVKVQGVELRDRRTGGTHRHLVVESRGNYNLALFGQGENTFTISRQDFDSDGAFTKALVQNGLVSEEDLDIFYKPDARVRPYLNQQLPRIVLA